MHNNITEIKKKKKVIDDEEVWKGAVFRLSTGK